MNPVQEKVAILEARHVIADYEFNAYADATEHSDSSPSIREEFDRLLKIEVAAFNEYMDTCTEAGICYLYQCYRNVYADGKCSRHQSHYRN